MEHENKEGNEAYRLLLQVKEQLPQLKILLEEMASHWGYEDPIYRFYHQSFKVYAIQTQTQQIVAALKALAPHLELNSYFLQIVAEGTGKQFSQSHNQNWLHHTRPMVEAFFMAKHMLEMVCKYAQELSEPPQILPSGWATVLYLYNLR